MRKKITSEYLIAYWSGHLGRKQRTGIQGPEFVYPIPLATSLPPLYSDLGRFFQAEEQIKSSKKFRKV